MKKMLKMMAVFVLSMVLLLSLQSVSAASYNAPMPLTVYDAEFYATQAKSIEAYNRILNGLNSPANAASLDGASNYSDYYGGAYIDSETGKLIVLVTDVMSSQKESIHALAGENEDIEFRQCETSFSKIEEAIAVITDHMIDLYDCGIDIVSVSDDIMNGQVDVYVKDLNAEKESAIRAIANYDFLMFFNSEGGELQTAYGAGSVINSVKDDSISYSRDESSTVCFGATRNGKKGLVVAGHAGFTYGCKFKIGDISGSVTKSAVQYSATTADAAFVEFPNGINISNSVYFSNLSGGEMATLPLNTQIMMRGGMSGFTTGKITAVNATHSFVLPNGIKIYCSKNMEGDYPSQAGDSGSPIVYVKDNQIGRVTYKVVGIHSQAFGNGKKGFSPYSNIVNELGVSWYHG